MTKNRTPTPVCLDPGMHSGLEVKGLNMINKETNKQIRYASRLTHLLVDISMTNYDIFAPKDEKRRYGLTTLNEPKSTVTGKSVIKLLL